MGSVGNRKQTIFFFRPGGGSFCAPNRIRRTACEEWTRMIIVGRIMIGISEPLPVLKKIYFRVNWE